jgi:hypothetical protein
MFMAGRTPGIFTILMFSLGDTLIVNPGDYSDIDIIGDITGINSLLIERQGDL